MDKVACVSDAPWTPFGLSTDEEADYHVLKGSLSQGARQQVINWIRQFIDGDSWLRVSLVRDIQLKTDVWLAITTQSAIRTTSILPVIERLTDMELLRVADYLVANTGYESRKRELDSILEAARSKWTVGERSGRPGIVDRVPAGVQEFAEAVFGPGTTAGRVLARAWASVHGLESSPSSAYADAVRAVEIVAISEVQPNHSTATLGTVLGQMKSDGDWRLPLREHSDAPSAELLLSMLRTLWFGHRDRHGNVDYSDVTLQEARSAVALAVSLVDWFASGAIARRSA
jgi:hypothetical protein